MLRQHRRGEQHVKGLREGSSEEGVINEALLPNFLEAISGSPIPLGWHSIPTPLFGVQGFHNEAMLNSKPLIFVAC